MITRRARHNTSNILVLSTSTFLRYRINHRQTRQLHTVLRFNRRIIIRVLHNFTASSRITHSRQASISSHLHRMPRPFIRALAVPTFTLTRRQRRAKRTFTILRRNFQQTMQIRTSALPTVTKFSTKRRTRILRNTIKRIQPLMRHSVNSRHATQTPFRVSTSNITSTKIRPRLNRNQDIQIISRRHQRFSIPNRFLRHRANVTSSLPRNSHTTIQKSCTLSKRNSTRRLTSQARRAPHRFNSRVTSRVMMITNITMKSTLTFTNSRLTMRIRHRRHSTIHTRPRTSHHVQFHNRRINLHLTSTNQFHQLTSSSRSLVLGIARVNNSNKRTRPRNRLRVLLNKQTVPMRVISCHLAINLFSHYK